jgi:Heparinase II/III-like protein/Heparinase II/III N-terminus
MPRRRLAVGLVLLAAIAGAPIMLVGGQLQPPPSTDSPPCPPRDRDAARVLYEPARAVVLACQRGGSFMDALRVELGQSLGDQSDLWRAGAGTGDSDEALDAWRAGRLVSLSGRDPWPVPVDPDWSEDPYDNLTWSAHYQSLAWLQALARGYRAGDKELGEDLRRYVLDWIESNPRQDAKSERAWYNGAVHRRTNTIVAMWDVLLEVLDDRELVRVLASLRQHGNHLDSYLRKPSFYGNNHNLFHALSLLNLAKNVPVFQPVWERDARARIHTLLREMVDATDGVSTEQASGYHYLAARLFTTAQRYLRADGDSLSEEDMGLLGEMTRFGALLPHPGGTVPAIGDSPSGASDGHAWGSIERIRDLGVTTPEADFIISRGAEGERPDDATFFEGQGYAIFRPSYGDAGAWEDDLHVVVDMGPDARVHGHDDAMNVVLAAHGEELLIDSGGPYQYGVRDRRAFTGPAAHNLVVVDGGAYGDGAVTVERAIDRPSYSIITGSHARSPGVSYRRSVLVLKPRIVVVVDELRATDGKRHRFDLLYHLPPHAAIEADGTDAVVTVGAAGMGLAVVGNRDPEAVVRRGESDPLFGWVTPSNGERDPAPVVDVSQDGTSAWFVTAISPTPAGDAAVARLSVERDGTTFLISVRHGGETWEIRLPAEGEPRVR